jgi:quinoprotein glucose dehydrogenase
VNRGGKEKLARFEASRPKGDHLASYRETLAGGDVEAGRRIFFTRAEVSCMRCHKVCPRLDAGGTHGGR